MRPVIFFIAVFLIITGLVVGTATLIPQRQRTIVAFCGAANKPVVEEAASIFESKTGIKVEIHLGGSGTMLSQMEISKTGDVYIPGSHDYMNRAVKDGVVYQDTIKTFAYVVPAIIVQKGNPKNIQSLEDLAKPGIRVGIGAPESVCVGQYAVEVLKYNNLFDQVSKNIVVHAESCEKTAAVVVIGQVDAVIGWEVFQKWNPKETDVIFIPPAKIPRISCLPGAVSTFTQDRDSAQKFIDFLSSSEGQQIYRKYGYLVTLEEARVLAPDAETPTF